MCVWSVGVRACVCVCVHSFVCYFFFGFFASFIARLAFASPRQVAGRLFGALFGDFSTPLAIKGVIYRRHTHTH